MAIPRASHCPGPTLGHGLLLLALCVAPVRAIASDTSPSEGHQTVEAFYQHWSDERHAQRRHPLRSAAEYRRFLSTVNLDSDEGLMTWAARTQIPVVALSADLDTFVDNRHLSHEDCDGQLQLLVHGDDTGVVCVDWSGYVRRYDPLPSGWLKRTRRVGQCRVLPSESLEPNLAALEDYLILPGDVDQRQGISKGIAALPFSMIRLLAGKAIYLSRTAGRSFALIDLLGTTDDHNGVGLTPGAFMYMGPTRLKAESLLVHELCHLVDQMAIVNGIDRILYPEQYRAVATLRRARYRLFTGDPEVRSYYDPDFPEATSPGFMTAYSRTNAFEDFAVHCHDYILLRDRFIRRATTEAAKGDITLIDKYNFLVCLFEHTDTRRVRVSRLNVATFACDEDKPEP